MGRCFKRRCYQFYFKNNKLEGSPNYYKIQNVKKMFASLNSDVCAAISKTNNLLLWGNINNKLLNNKSIDLLSKITNVDDISICGENAIIKHMNENNKYVSIIYNLSNITDEFRIIIPKTESIVNMYVRCFQEGQKIIGAFITLSGKILIQYIDKDKKIFIQKNNENNTGINDNIIISNNVNKVKFLKDMLCLFLMNGNLVTFSIKKILDEQKLVNVYNFSKNNVKDIQDTSDNTFTDCFIQ